MTAKQSLIEYVRSLSEDEATSLYQRIQMEAADERVPLTPEEIEAVKRGIASADAGRLYTTEEVRRRLGIS